MLFDEIFGFNESDYSYWDNYYNQLKEDIYKRVFPNYPEKDFLSFEIKFKIRETAKNGVLVYEILEHVPTSVYSITDGETVIFVGSESDYVKTAPYLFDVISVTSNWVSFEVKFNGKPVTNQDMYYINQVFLSEDVRRRLTGWNEPIENIRKKYHKKPRKQQTISKQVSLNGVELSEVLQIIVDEYVNEFASNLSVDVFYKDFTEQILMFDGTVIIDFYLSYNEYQNEYQKIETITPDLNRAGIVIQDLTFNALFKFNFSRFRKMFERGNYCFHYFPFKGIDVYNKQIDRIPVVNERFPELKIIQRYESDPGELYHNVVFEMSDETENNYYAVGYTKDKVHSYVLKVCSELETKNSRSLKNGGCSSLKKIESGFIEVFLSKKGERKKDRLEKSLSYFVVDKYMKEYWDIVEMPSVVLQEVKDGKYNDYERGYYKKPINKWKTEELVYNIVKKLYGQYQVLYQYHPYYLKTDQGSMSYDIYICGLKVAVEYQGKQHFEPVDFFGGEENHKRQKERDSLKKRLSDENGVKLVYINYWESVTPELIKEKIENIQLL